MQKKLLLSLAVISLSTVAFAEESSMNSLSYRVKGKEFHYNLGMEFSKPKYNESIVDPLTPGAANTLHASFETSKTRWLNDLSYGVSDSWSFSLGLDVSLKNGTKETAESIGSVARVGSAGAVADFSTLEEKNTGLEDIRLGSSFRYLTGDVKADLLVGVAISGKSKAADTHPNQVGTTYVATEGDAKSGGSSIQLATQFAGASGSFEWATGFGINYKMEKKIAVVGGDQNATSIIDLEKVIKSNMDVNLNLAGQFNLSPEFALGANLGVAFAPKEETTLNYFNATTTDVVTLTDKTHTDLTLGLNGKYQVATNIDLGLNYSHLFAADIDGSIVDKVGSVVVANRTTQKTDRKDDRFGFNFAVRF